MDEREKLQERYDDAAFALMMDECAEADGEAFLAEFRAAAEAGNLPEIPADLDRRFRDTIKREFAARERKVRFRQFKRAAARVAVAVFAVIGILSTLIMSVDAWRVPILNYIIEKDGKFFTIDSDQDSKTAFEEINACMPDGYEVISREENGDMISIAFQNAEGDFALFESIPTEDGFRFDAEDVENRGVTVLGCDGVLIAKNGFRIMWLDGKGATVYSIYATRIGEEELLQIAEIIASCLC